MLRSATQIRRVEELPLQRGADPVHDAGTNLTAARDLVSHGLQEGVAPVARQRPRSREHGSKLGIGKADHRQAAGGNSGGRSSCARSLV